MKKNDDQTISVTIVDDHKVLVEGLERCINDSGVAHVIDREYSITGCLLILKRRQPDVLLLDVSLPDGNSIEFCPDICRMYPDVHILMLTNYAESAVINRALTAGALGYILKNAMSDEIIEGIQVVARGERFLCDETEELFKKDTSKPIMLTNREREVLSLIIEGYSCREISEKIFLSFDTVHDYFKYLRIKLGVKNTASMVSKAIEQKLV